MTVLPPARPARTSGRVPERTSSVAEGERPRARPALFRLYTDLRGPTSAAVTAVALASLVGAWALAAALDLAADLFLPSPLQVLARAGELAGEGTLWDDTQVSFVRMTIGFGISSAIALPVGILAGSYRPFTAAVEPVVDFIRYMPAVAFVPLTIIWVGVGESQKWLVVFLGTFFAQVLMFSDAVKQVPRAYVDTGRTLGMSEPAILRRIAIRAAAPSLWDALRITLGWAWTWLVVAELVAATSGLGHRVVIAQRFFQTDTIFVAVLTIGVLGLIMDQTMRITGRLLFPWRAGVGR